MADSLELGSGYLAHRHGPGADHHPDRRERPVRHADRGGAGADGAGGGDARGGRAVRVSRLAWSVFVLAVIAAGWGAACVFLAAGWGHWW